MIKINARSILHTTQRYSTVGDWYELDGVERIVRASDTGNDDYDFLILLHEQIEQHLCLKRGITASAVDEFDIAFENSRQEGDNREPGDLPECPYRDAHQFATLIERMMALKLGVNWDEYEKRLNSL